ncbi:hypothetical protein ACI68E_001614 [Malassezia pachydermatis]|uniref:Kinetochore protein Spc24 n=1 Tax=Malassezia pachydermatis TaxID=77020 RepID=A0A0N0RSQ9_9BASI|nr:hypothetical protein Malapachy_3165 [Malassezia pachydermatis]KOS16345.1 hypothetical protein Malapachy_3165 [Malassezia pachydermatis]
MKDMEDQKFDLAKKINEQESMLSSLESEIDELRRESDVLESWDIEEEVGMDRNALSLQLFRGMGFVPYQESTEPDAAITSLIVRSLRRNVATSFDINQDELMKSTKLRYELAKKLWTAAD